MVHLIFCLIISEEINIVKKKHAMYTYHAVGKELLKGAVLISVGSIKVRRDLKLPRN